MGLALAFAFTFVAKALTFAFALALAFALVFHAVDLHRHGTASGNKRACIDPKLRVDPVGGPTMCDCLKREDAFTDVCIPTILSECELDMLSDMSREAPDQNRQLHILRDGLSTRLLVLRDEPIQALNMVMQTLLLSKRRQTHDR